MRTVPSLAQVPGAVERGRRELVRLLSVRHGVRFVVVDDESEKDDEQPFEPSVKD